MGGGGGSSYTNPLYVTSVTHTQGYNCGDGMVNICILPDPGTITGTISLCAGATTMLNDTAAGGSWSSDSLSIATVSPTGMVTAVLAGTATISYSVSNACGTIAATTLFTVNPIPNAGTITGKDSLCAGHTDTLSNATSGGVWSSYNTTIATIGTGTGIVSGVAPGMDTIYYTVTVLGCTSMAKIPITVRSHAACISGVNTITGTVNESFRVSPNPGPGTFTINLSSSFEEDIHYVVTNMVGEHIREFTGLTNKATILQLDVATGVYTLSATTMHGKWIEKVMVIR